MAVSVQNRNLQILATKMYKIKNDISPLIVTELIDKHHNLGQNTQLTTQLGKHLIPRT